MQKKGLFLKKVGAKPLPRYPDRISSVRKKIETLRIPIAILSRAISLPMSYNNLLLKLKGELGIHEAEIDAIEKAVNNFEKKLMAQLNNG